MTGDTMRERARTANAQHQFVSPEQLLRADMLTDAEKLEMLLDWDLELDNRLMAEAEGMGASDPMRSRNEAQLADESGRVKDAIKSLRH